MKNIALVYGGEGSEHSISKLSAKYIEENIDTNKFNLNIFELDKGLNFLKDSKAYSLLPNKTLVHKDESIDIDYLIPCIHGYPGETGDIQSILDAYQIKYLGCESEASKICFNKILTKLFLEHIGVKTTPFISVTKDDFSNSMEFLQIHKTVFVKATNQGSSIGCYKVDNQEDLKEKIDIAFTLSKHVILEVFVTPRELEVAVFEYKGEIHITSPSEIIHEGKFYDYDEKYSNSSSAKTTLTPKLSEKQLLQIKEISLKVFKELKLKDLSRLDFFLVENELYVNEVNTFPGMTSISLFPKMMESYGVEFRSFIEEKLSV